MSAIHVWVDGAVSSNGQENSVGGWGCVIKTSEDSNFGTIKSGGEKNTTNNRMELKSVYVGLKEARLLIKKLVETRAVTIDLTGTISEVIVNIHSDSAYVVNAFNSGWIRNWQKNNWLNSEFLPVKNRDLWEGILKEIENFKEVKFIKVKGHEGNLMNEFADTLATKAVMETRIKNKLETYQ